MAEDNNEAPAIVVVFEQQRAYASKCLEGVSLKDVSTILHNPEPMVQRERAPESIRELEGGGGSWRWAVALLGGHTPSKNPRPISWLQAYIAKEPIYSIESLANATW